MDGGGANDRQEYESIETVKHTPARSPGSDRPRAALRLLSSAEDGLLLSGSWGFEREALRVDGEGRLSEADHPFPQDLEGITNDFAENQVELVTKPRGDPGEALAELDALHREAYSRLGDELLWPLSVPGRWDEPERLRPARFGDRPEKEAARRYRDYLLERYGRARQAITGLHYNFSFPAAFWEALRKIEGSPEGLRGFSDRRYFDLARNFLRYRSVLGFLYSASPPIDAAFADELAAGAPAPDRAMKSACAGRLASLRLGPLGYRLEAAERRALGLRFDSLGEYLSKVGRAVERAGGTGLRSEGELYAPLRPKAAYEGERGSLSALDAMGVQYLELRVFDLDPFARAGIGAEAIRLVHLFALACLLEPSPPLGRDALEDDRVSGLAHSCSLRPGEGLPDARVGALVEAGCGRILRAMGDIAERLPSEYGKALEGAFEALRGRRPRSVDRFLELSAGAGGGLEAGLALARDHKSSYAAAEPL